MNSTNDFDEELPFVREECGDTMWDDATLNQLTPAMGQRPPLPPFTLETARQKVQMAEDAWNSKAPERVSLAYTVDTEWPNRFLMINRFVRLANQTNFTTSIMARNYASLAFTDPVKALQERYGSRRAYDRVEKQTQFDGLTDSEIRFIAHRDSFYMASFGENGFPYIQHRGGPKGFLKAIDTLTLGFVDFRGNKQYISVGNILTHPQVSLILVDYVRQARLKIYAEAEIVELADRPDLRTQLDPADYPHTPERMLLLYVKAFDWNCPQHITPRYTAEEVNLALAPQRDYIAQLEAEIAQLRSAQK